MKMVEKMDDMMYVCSITSNKEKQKMSRLNQYDELMQKIGKDLVTFVFPVEMNRIMHISPNIHLMASLLSSRLPFTDSFQGSPFFLMCIYTYLNDFNKTIGRWDKKECEKARKHKHDRFQAFIQTADEKDGCARALIDLHSFEQEVNDLLKENHNDCPICHGLGRHCTQFDIERLDKLNS